MTTMPNAPAAATDSNAAAIVRATFAALFAGDQAPFDEHPGLHQLRHALPALRAAFPDFSAELKQQLVDGDRVASHWIFRGTHLGDLYGIAPTGRSVEFQNLSICRVVENRIVEYNSEVGFLSVFKQLGVLPLR